MRRWVLLTMLVAVTTGGASEAEYERLVSEMRSRAERNAWSGVDQAYERAGDLRGVKLDYDDHMLGAKAAKELGNMNELSERLEAAGAISGTEEVFFEQALLFAAYGKVRIRVARQVEDPSLEVLDPPFDPVVRRTIETAAKALQTDRKFEGLLPLGRYRVGETRFDVVGEPLLEVKVKRPSDGGR